MTKKLITGHVEHLNSLWDKGHLIFCGPCSDGSAVMILKAKSLSDVDRLVQDDPFTKVKYYQSIEIKEVQNANPGNNFHLEEVLDYLDSK